MLLIIEKIMPAFPDGSFLVDSDIIALSLGGGRERTLQDFKNLGLAAGLKLNRVFNTNAGISIMEFELI